MKKQSFLYFLLSLIALCSVLSVVIVIRQQLSYETQLKTTQLELAATKEELLAYEATLAAYKNELETAKDNIASLSAIQSEEAERTQLSNTQQFLDWQKAQFVVEPDALYIQLKLAYTQFIELYEKGFDGTEKYKTALNLLVPSSKQDSLDTYLGTLKRYYGAANTDKAIDYFIDDLVKAGLLTSKGNNYYSWNYSTLTSKNVVSKLGVTQDVADSLLGLLRCLDWSV